MRCSSCGQDNPAGFRFCGACGAALEEATPARETRKVVTIVFCDLTGSTALGERTDPETLRATMRGYYDAMRTILERHGGTVEKFVGDAVMAVFGVPVSHEDDALRAVRAAWEMREAVPQLGLLARIGVNTGEVVTGEGDTLVTGDAVNVAARLEQAANAGEVLIGAETRRLVRDAVRVEPVEVTAKGKSQPLASFRLADVDVTASAITRRLDTPLVGRRREVARLRHAYERAVTERACHLFTLLGPAGVGKSRLVSEFLGEVDVDATVLRGRCLDYGEGITFWPVIEILKQLGARADATVDRVVQGGTSPNETFWAVRAQLEEVARERPLLVVFDDVHSAEPTFLDLIDHIADLSRDAPILLLCLARPELLDDRPNWGGGKLNATTALLEPLSRDECLQLIELQGDGFDGETRTRVLDAAGGNPLFLEEMLALASESDEVRVPSTIQALLQARLDRLGQAERSVIERGAVEGEIFHRGAVRELAPEHVDVASHLIGLVRKDLIRPQTSQLAGEEAYRFRHLLVRDAAYDSLPKATRADLHERFADWLLEHGAALVELDEITGWHMEQAALYRAELGTPDVTLQERAAERLSASGQRAKNRGDLPAARTLLTRAAALADDRQRPELLVDVAAILIEYGAFAEAFETLGPLLDDSDLRIAHHARVVEQYGRTMSDSSSSISDSERVGDEAIRVFEQLGDELGLARAWWLLSMLSWGHCHAAVAEARFRRTIEHADRAGEVALANLARGWALLAALFGPDPPERVAALVTEIVAPGAAPVLACWVRWTDAWLAGFAGRLDEARDGFDAYKETMVEFGYRASAVASQMAIAEMELREGLVAEPGARLEGTVDELEELDERAYLSTALGELAQVRCAEGRYDEAEALARRALELGVPDDQSSSTLASMAFAEVHASRGELDEALRLAGEATSVDWDFVATQADLLVRAAAVQRTAGSIEVARESLRTALELYEQKHAVRGAERARALLAEL